ncbi:unnamed protein product [Gongylonema pulchrum]|uniref:Glycosyltransferase family 92 protein n=1 Tax=Gongylonema pulchrum TaxID=637853 RepID=A0A183E4W4_9BILA|nr:unnamed protein product [Gongylonema pulchrum]
MLCSFWNSRSRLLRISICLTLLNISLSIFRDFLDEPTEAKFKTDNRNGGDFDEDMDYVLETIQYMHDLKIGKAEIRPVVEKEAKVRQYWWRCRLAKPNIVVLNDWLQNDDLSVYSATYDRRHSSLYPNNHVVQGMDFADDKPERLIEWVEMQLMAGADAITIYQYHVPRKMLQVLDYYARKKLLTVVSFSKNPQHIDTHKYVLILDVDEVIVPLKHDNWSAITDTVSTVFNHFALHRQHGNVRKTLYVNPDVALKLHYKEKCPIESGRQCEQLERVTVDDTSMDKYAEELTQRVTRVLKILKFIN